MKFHWIQFQLRRVKFNQHFVFFMKLNTKKFKIPLYFNFQLNYFLIYFEHIHSNNLTVCLTLSSYADSMVNLLASVSHEVFLFRSHMKSSAVASKMLRACSQWDRVLFRNSEMFTDSDCDFSTGKRTQTTSLGWI